MHRVTRAAAHTGLIQGHPPCPAPCASRATHVAQAACAVRMKVTPDIFAAAKHGDTQLVADHVFVDPSLVSKRDVV